MIFPVYQFDDFGNFVAEIDSGLEGYIPPNCTHVAPPELSAGQYAIYKHGQDEWYIASAPITPPVIEQAARAAQPKGLTGAQYILFVKQAGGITGTQYLGMKADGDCAAFLDAALADRDLIYPTTDHVTDGLEFLAAKGFLPNGVTAVIANWPAA
jgi:hypothetical protein